MRLDKEETVYKRKDFIDNVLARVTNFRLTYFKL